MSDSGSSEPSVATAEKGLPQIQNAEPQTSPAELTQGFSRWFKASYSFLYVEVSSLILLFACIAMWCPTPWFKYAISVASISFGICLILQTMEFLQPGFLEKPVIGEHSSEKLCSVFMLLWWIFGTGFITFKGPFIFTFLKLRRASPEEREKAMPRDSPLCAEEAGGVADACCVGAEAVGGHY